MAVPITAEEIERLQEARDIIRSKATELGIADQTALLHVLAAAIDSIQNRGSVSISVKEGETAPIPAGYHDGTGTVSGVSGGGNYALQSKSVTPTKNQQPITPDAGYYGLSDVMVQAIPAAFQNVSGVTATAEDVLSPKIIVTADGKTVAGAIVNNGQLIMTIDGLTVTSVNIPAGYTTGGSVSLTDDIANALAAI